jgi:2-polyprenyl-3-methyl-5-hydroxy-6-metoxy-1,4-benzoquinol methylase
MNQLVDKQYWEQTHQTEKALRDETHQGPDPKRTKPTFLRAVKTRIKSLLGQKFLGYIRSYEDFFLWEVLYSKYLPAQPGLKALEIGSAPGDHLVRLQERFGFEPYGVEYTKIGVDLNREVFLAHGIDPDNVIHDDFLSEELQQKYKGYFDVVISRGFIEHFTNPEPIVSKHLNLLRNDGLLIISIPNVRGINYLLGLLFNRAVLPLHNLEIMETKSFTRLFESKSVTPLFCGYYGIFNFALTNTTNNALKQFALAMLLKLQVMLNVIFRVLFAERGAESPLTSPALIFIGKKEE